MTLRAAASGMLSFGRASVSTPSVAEAWAAAPRSQLQRLFGSEALRELDSILRERDSRLMGEALLSLASRLEGEGRSEAAMELYQGVVSSSSPESQSLVRLAQERLDVMQGRGPLSLRIESLARRFVDHATDPVMIASFGVASGVASLTRLSAGAWLASRGSGLLTRGFGARLGAGLLAYSAEVPAFVGARRLFSGVLRGELEHQPSLRDELASAALFMGVMQVAGTATTGLLSGRQLTPLARGFWQGASGMGGVYFAHRLEEGFGLRPARDEASRWVDTADTWLQMRVGARLMHGMEGGLALRQRGESLFRLGLASLGEPRLRRLGASEIFSSSELPAAYLRRGLSEADKQAASDPQLRPLSEAWGLNSTPEALRAVHVIGTEVGQLPRLVEMLVQTRIQDPLRLEVSLRRLRHMVEHSRPIGVRGNYLEWLGRLAVTEVLRRNEPVLLDRLLNFLYDGAELMEFEKSLEPLLPQYRFLTFPKTLLKRAMEPFAAVSRRINRLPLGVPARDLLQDTQNYLRRMNPTDPLYLDMGQILDTLETVFRERRDLIPEIERAMAPIRLSPMSYLRVFRLHRLLTRQVDVYPKLRELSEGLRLVGFQDRVAKNPLSADTVDSTQFNGFFDEPRMAELFADFYRRMPHYMDPVNNEVAIRRRQTIFRELWPEPRQLNADDAAVAFERLGDPISLEVAEILRQGRVDLQFLDGAAFEAEVDRYVSGNRSRSMVGVMIPPAEPEGRSRILVRQIENISPQVFHQAAFKRLAYVVHEVEHFLHTDPSVPRGVRETLRQEMQSSLREYQWQAANGEYIWVAVFALEASAGYALHLRSSVESWNIRYSDPND